MISSNKTNNIKITYNSKIIEKKRIIPISINSNPNPHPFIIPNKVSKLTTSYLVIGKKIANNQKEQKNNYNNKYSNNNINVNNNSSFLNNYLSCINNNAYSSVNSINYKYSNIINHNKKNSKIISTRIANNKNNTNNNNNFFDKNHIFVYENNNQINNNNNKILKKDNSLNKSKKPNEIKKKIKYFKINTKHNRTYTQNFINVNKEEKKNDIKINLITNLKRDMSDSNIYMKNFNLYYSNNNTSKYYKNNNSVSYKTNKNYNSNNKNNNNSKIIKISMNKITYNHNKSISINKFNMNNLIINSLKNKNNSNSSNNNSINKEMNNRIINSKISINNNNNNNKNIQKKFLNTKNNQLKKNKSKDLTRASIKINLNDIIKEIKINNYLSKDKNKNYNYNIDNDSDKENINSNVNRKIINFKDYKTNEVKSSNFNYNLKKNFSIEKKIINVDKENEFNNILFNKEYLNEFPFETENFNDLNSIVKKLKLDEILIKSNSIFNISNNKIRNNYNKIFETKFQLFKKIEIKNYFTSINNSSGHSKYKSGKKNNYSFSTQANSSFKKVNYVN